jgi:hypothetical protein
MPDHVAPRRIVASISGVPTRAIATSVDSVAAGRRSPPRPQAGRDAQRIAGGSTVVC